MAHEPRLEVRDGNGRGHYPAPEMFKSVMKPEGEPWHKHPLFVNIMPLVLAAVIALVMGYARAEAQDARLREVEAEVRRIAREQQVAEVRLAQTVEKLNGLVTRFEDSLQQMTARIEQQNERK